MTKYKLTIEIDNEQELREISMLPNYQSLIFELENNFHRKFKNLDNENEDFYRGVQEVLNQLRKTTNTYLNQE